MKVPIIEAYVLVNEPAPPKVGEKHHTAEEEVYPTGLLHIFHTVNGAGAGKAQQGQGENIVEVHMHQILFQNLGTKAFEDFISSFGRKSKKLLG